jgi:hypothetical protein
MPEGNNEDNKQRGRGKEKTEDMHKEEGRLP